MYAKVDKSRKSRISTTDESIPLTSVLVNYGRPLSTHNEADPDDLQPDAVNQKSDDTVFVDNDLYEKDSDGDRRSNSGLFAVSNYPDEEETYEIPEDVTNHLKHDLNQLAPPVAPVRTSLSSGNSACFAATPPVPHRHSSLALRSITPPLPPRHSSLLSTPRKAESKSSDKLDRERTPKLPPRLSVMLPIISSSASPEQKRATFVGNFVPMPLNQSKTIETSSESALDASSESDFEEIPPPRQHAPPPPVGATAVEHNGATDDTTGFPNPVESDYLEPISLSANRNQSHNHDYDPVYIPSNPGASHIAHLVDNTNYLKGGRNRSPSKASINQYEEIQFNSEVYTDVDERTMVSSPLETSTPAPPWLTPRSSRSSDPVTPQLSRRSPSVNSSIPQIPSRPPSSRISATTPQSPPRSHPTKSDDGPTLSSQNGVVNLPSEPRYSGLLVDSEDDQKAHEYTPLDYEDHQASSVTNATNGNNTENAESIENNRPNSKINGENSNAKLSAFSNSTNNEAPKNEDSDDYDAVSTNNNINKEEIYEAIEGVDKDGIYEAIDFAD